jgi:glycerophosphoryl diester phosphodiesterase
MSVWKIGHRGACGHEPENTLLSIKKALEFGVDGIEFDIQVSKDGEPVVIHDDTLERTTNGKGAVSEYTLAELQKFDAGKGEKIPSLRQLFDVVDKRCRLFIELKAHDCTEAVAELTKHYVAKGGWSYEQLFICAFDHQQLIDMRNLNANLRTCALIAGIPVTLAQIASEARAWAINPNIHHMNQELVDDAHRRNLKVITWTANTPAEIAHAKVLGVDGIISNYPDRIGT